MAMAILYQMYTPPKGGWRAQWANCRHSQKCQSAAELLKAVFQRHPFGLLKEPGKNVSGADELKCDPELK